MALSPADFNPQTDRPPHPVDQASLLGTLWGDGRPLLKLTALGLLGAGCFACFLGWGGHFLPHDLEFLQMSVQTLRQIAESRLVYFMIHDRVSFGGALIAIAVLYLWLTEFPLRQGEAWAWWTLWLSGAAGFTSFLAYLGYGYLDTWHGLATLTLLVTFLLGMFRARTLLVNAGDFRHVSRSVHWPGRATALDWGRWLLLVSSACLMLGGSIIMSVGMSWVFVPTDLTYMKLSPEDIERCNPRLIPLIAHDRAGFGGAVACCGLTMFCCVACGRPARHLWEALLLVGLAGFGTAIGVHFPIGYTDASHLAPAFLGATIMSAGLVLSFPGMMRGGSAPSDGGPLHGP